jgi:hypothetical protein
VVEAAPNDPQILCDELLGSLIPDGAPSDDVALLALRMIPMSERFDVEFVPEPEALVPMRALLRAGCGTRKPERMSLPRSSLHAERRPPTRSSIPARAVAARSS